MANIGLYPVGNTPRYYLLNSIATAPAKGAQDGISPQSARGTVKEQDVMPSLRQATEGVASTEAPSTARATWRGFAGSFGLLKQSDAPGDLTRPYLTNMDNTRPGQLTAWLRFGSADTVPVDSDGSAEPPQWITALVNATAGWGFGAVSVLASSYWLWNGTKFAWQRTTDSNGSFTWQNSSRLPPYTKIFAGASFPAPPIVQQTGTNLWLPEVTGCTDLSVAAAAGVGVANAYHTFVYFDILFVVSVTAGNLTITPYRPRTPSSTNIPQSATLAGLSNALLTIPGEAVCMGAVPCEGAVYLCTDRSVYAIQWNDQNNTFLSNKLFELPRITGAPVVWNGEVYIPADGRIAHIVPNQRGYDWRVPDAMGVMPSPYNGMIVQLLAFSDCLIAQMTDPYGNGGHCYLRMDANGVWTTIYDQVTNWSGRTSNAASGPMLPIVDGTNPQAIAFPNLAGTVFSSMFVCSIPQTNKNPRTLATTQRKQRPGPFYLVTPWFDLEAEGAQKILQRLSMAVLDASSSYPIRAYYQTDFADESGSDTFSVAPVKGTGTWHKCFYAAASSSAYAGSTDTGGRGQLWFEFDARTVYTDSIGFLALYPTYKRVRFCLEINGDTTGTTVPTILTTLFDRIEFVTKAFQRVYVLRLQTNERNGHSPANGGTDAVSIPNSATLITEYNRLKGYDSGKTLLTESNEKGEIRTVLMTKFDGALSAVNPDGTPAEYTITVTTLDATLSGLS